MYLYQNNFKIDSVMNMAEKKTQVEIPVDLDLIKEDKKAYRDKYERSNKNKYDRENLLSIVNYLEKLTSIVYNNKIELTWGISKKLNLPITKPVILYKEKTYSFDALAYYLIEPFISYVDVNLYGLAELIAFEIIFRDLGETNSSIEELLHNCGIIGVSDGDLLLKYFADKGYKPYEDSMVMKIEDSPYIIRDNGALKDYFGSRSIKTKYYRDIVEYSCMLASTIVADNILKNAANKSINIQMLAILPTCVRFLVGESVSEECILRDLIGKIDIRIFGRRFRLSNNVAVYGC